MKDSLKDVISGTLVRATDEETKAVQPFAKALMTDYGYPKESIQTRPQWRVRSRPSDEKGKYPVDIVVFNDDKHIVGNEYIVVECKRPDRKSGRNQLEDYLRFCPARLGVWYNGNERLFLLKTESEGKVLFTDIPNIPRFGQRIEDVGLFLRKDLKLAANLRTIFVAIRNYWAANAVGITRDEIFAQQMINLIFCKIYDERFTRPEDMVSFRAGINEEVSDVRERILRLFENVRDRYDDVIGENDEIELDDESLVHFVGEIQQYCLIDSSRDAIADAFEVFISNALKGPQGQFFTPRNVVRLVINMLDPAPKEKVIDPACGSGGFLIEVLRHLWQRVQEQGESLDWPEQEIQAEKQRVAIQNVRGIDKDSFLAKVAKAYMAIIGDGRGGVFCENSLESPNNWTLQAQNSIQLGSFDVVVTNPPFGVKQKIAESTVLGQFQTGYKWSKDRKTGEFHKTSSLRDSQPPQVLFIERCLQLLKPGGRLGFIAPESLFSNPTHRYIMQYIESVAHIRAVVSFPEELFQPYTHAKTCAVIIEKPCEEDVKGEDSEIFMAEARWCGHDSRGILIPRDDIPDVENRYEQYLSENALEYDHLGFVHFESQISSHVYVPKYYDPEISRQLVSLEPTHDLLNLGDLISNGKVEVATGDEVGKLSYGTGSIPFVRTSDIANWEIKGDPKHGLSEEIYNQFKEKQDVRALDILMVRDGTYLVGTCALITQLDVKVVYQSHIYKIRSLDHDSLHPYLLLAVLSSPIVQKQVYAKRFTQDIIDTLGNRIRELVLPIPKLDTDRSEIVSSVSQIIDMKVTSRQQMRSVILKAGSLGKIENNDAADDTDEYSFFLRGNVRN